MAIAADKKLHSIDDLDMSLNILTRKFADVFGPLLIVLTSIGTSSVYKMSFLFGSDLGLHNIWG